MSEDMKAGLLINNDFLTIAYQKTDDDFKFAEYNGDREIYLYFQYDEDKKPPVVLDKDAREIYYPGNEEVLGDFLKFLDSENDVYEKSNLSFKSSDILNGIFDEIVKQNSDIFSSKANEKINPFYLIIPPYLGEVAKSKVIHAFRKRVKYGRIAYHLNPYIYYLLSQKKIPSSGKVLFLEMCFSDIYFYVIKTSLDGGKQKIEIEKEEKLGDTNILFQFLKAISEEIVNLAIEQYASSKKFTPAEIEEEVRYNLSDAQDIMIGLSEIDEWSTIEIEAALSDDTGGPVTLKKENLQVRFKKVVDKSGLKSLCDSIVEDYQPSSFIFLGENFNNWGLSDFFNTYSKVEKIGHDKTFYENIYRIVFDQDESFDELDTDKLISGQLVTLYNYNTDPDKGTIGPSEHELKYLGNMEFLVERSTRSLQLGMTIKSHDKIWKKDLRLRFSVLKAEGFSVKELNGKSLNFIMRPNRSIDLRKWLN